ncbi:MAG TPA: hypothetical protein VN654_04955 [Vicinamibacterales bacterium]|jgi:hypothetical protein|nr:hypothetical protein [Vicinamibacterales bacterium]
MTKSSRHGCVILVVSALTTLGLSAQGTGRLTGNPTPGTPQPNPPNLADRITLTGCVRWAAPDGRGSVPSQELNTPSSSTFVLTNAARVTRVPPGTGTSDSAKKPASQTYRLSALNSALVPFVGARVEISGEIDDRPPREGAAPTPTLNVGFVQRLGKTPCS